MSYLQVTWMYIFTAIIIFLCIWADANDEVINSFESQISTLSYLQLILEVALHKFVKYLEKSQTRKTTECARASSLLYWSTNINKSNLKQFFEYYNALSQPSELFHQNVFDHYLCELKGGAQSNI